MSGPILICYDRSPAARAAIAAAAELFAGDETLVLTLWDAPLEAPADGLAPQVADDDGARLRGLAVAREGCGIAERAGLRCAPLTACGSARGHWQTIVALAKAHHAAAVVVGTRGRGTVASAVLGSVSAGVLRHAGCPVLVVAAPTGRSDVEDALRADEQLQGRLGDGS
jgi:nucleotide-binding universal stress UspA family protein